MKVRFTNPLSVSELHDARRVSRSRAADAALIFASIKALIKSSLSLSLEVMLLLSTSDVRVKSKAVSVSPPYDTPLLPPDATALSYFWRHDNNSFCRFFACCLAVATSSTSALLVSCSCCFSSPRRCMSPFSSIDSSVSSFLPLTAALDSRSIDSYRCSHSMLLASSSLFCTISVFTISIVVASESGPVPEPVSVTLSIIIVESLLAFSWGPSRGVATPPSGDLADRASIVRCLLFR
mmetsp:Transcript_16628/g.27750  ORF Transcript_16628/g.27750 Transcript_16628/m.27750 type:complete len:237 (-) Transcript_16628:2798-3508(-)